MNSSKILFLNMFKEDIKRHCKSSEDTKLTGQTITESEIRNFSSYKMMNDSERQIVRTILDSMKEKNSISNGKRLSKRFDTLIPRSNETVEMNDFRNAA